jgi:hypothetical protein
VKTEYSATPIFFDWVKFHDETIVPDFEIEIPSGWEKTISLLEVQAGCRLSWLSPLTASTIRRTGLDIILVQARGLPHQVSLQEYTKYVYEQERIGTQLLFLIEKKYVGGILSPEIKIHLNRTFAGRSGPVQMILVKQWVVIQSQDYFITIRTYARREK